VGTLVNLLTHDMMEYHKRHLLFSFQQSWLSRPYNKHVLTQIN